MRTIRRVLSCLLVLILTVTTAGAYSTSNNPSIYIVGDYTTQYDSVTEAISYAENNDIIVVKTSISENITIPQGKTIGILFWFNGHPKDKSQPFITNNGTLHLYGNGILYGSESAPAVYNAPGATLIAQEDPNNSGDYFCVLDFQSRGYSAVVNEGIMTLDSCTVKGDNSSQQALLVNQKNGDTTPVLNFVDGNIRDGKVGLQNGEGAEAIIGVPQGEISIGAHFDTDISLVNQGEILIHDISCYVTSLAFRNSGNITMEDGSLTVKEGGALFDNSDSATLSIQRGYFTQEVPSQYVAEGNRCVGFDNGTGNKYYLVDKAVDLTFQCQDETQSPWTIETVAGARIKIPENTFTAPTGYVFSNWTDGETSYWPGVDYTVGTEHVSFTANWSFAWPTISTQPDIGNAGSIVEELPYGTTVILTASHPLGAQAHYTWYARVENGGSMQEDVQVGEGAVFTASNLQQSMMYTVEVTDPNNPQAKTTAMIFIPVADSSENPDGGSTSGDSGSSGSGTQTDTTKNPDGSTTTTVTKPDGTVITINTDKNGNKTQTEKKPDGTTTTTVDNRDGSSSTTTVSASGVVEATVDLSENAVLHAASQGQAVALPMPSVPVTTGGASAPTVTVKLPVSGSVKVEIPVENVTTGTVAVLVKADGTEQVMKTSLTTDNGVAVVLEDGDTVKIVDNSKSFSDVPSSYWGASAIDFATSREIFSGTSSTTFSPDAAMNRAMIVTVLAAYEGVNTTSTSGAWYDAGRQWAVEHGISDGTNMDASLTREQLATMLWRYAGSPTVSVGLDGYTDSSSVSSYAAQAMAWAVDQGLISGMGGGTLVPQGTATRAQVATIMMRFVENMNG